jgi:GMP synthase (glutamine-hydrolysing)
VKNSLEYLPILQNGGLPEWLNLDVLEPLRDLYKDEVRRVGEILHIPKKLLIRHPFPGPGLAVRIMGEVTVPHGLLEKISNRITNEIEDVTWVSYVVSSKPPATIEPQ